MPSPSRLARLAVAAAALLACTAVLAVPSLRWRAQLGAMFAIGQIPDLSFGELVQFLAPSSPQSLERMIETKDPYAVIRNPLTQSPALAAGARRFKSECASCHAPDGSGSSAAPALVGRVYRHGESDWAVYRTIRYGVTGTAMQAHPLSSEQVWELAAHLRALNAGNEGGAAVVPGVAPPASAPLAVAELEAQRASGDDWLTYSGSYDGARHSALRDIDADNADELGVAWVHQFEGETGFIETTPLVRSGVMYLTLQGGRVIALDAATGKMLWDRPPASLAGAKPGQYSKHNRGVAMLGDRLFVGTGSGRLRALAAADGKVLWDVEVGDSQMYYISGAPLVVRDLVITGVGTIGGGRGYVVAYDVASGAERWRFTTIPAPGEPGNDSWGGDSWREGGAPTWLTGSYDAASDTLFWGVGNPKPDYDAAARPGDNLYSNSVIALRGATGKLLWHFQFTPADDHDWDTNQIPMLVDRVHQGVTERQLMLANRNGFYYVLNRDNGKFITGTPFAKQTWATGLDAKGRPQAVNLAGQSRGVVIYPGNTGATNWWSPSFDPGLDLVFVPTLEQGMVYFPSDLASGRSARVSYPSGAGRSLYTAVRALDARSGKLVWERRHATRSDNNVAGGLLSTAGGIVLGSDLSRFFALNARSGDLLWQFDTGGMINAAPITYRAGAQQFIAIAAGNSLFGFSKKAPARHRPTT